MFEITLTEDQQNAIIREYGSLDYCQAYIAQLANHLIEKHADDDRQARAKAFLELPEEQQKEILN